MADKARLHDIRKGTGKAEQTRRRVRITRDSGRAETVEERLSDKLRPERQSAKAVRGKLRVGGSEAEVKKRSSAGSRAAVNVTAAALHAARNTVWEAVGRSDNEDESSSGTDALQAGDSAVRNAGNLVNNARYSRKLKQSDQAARLSRKPDSAEASRQQERHKDTAPSSNPISRRRQKQELKKRYLEARASGKTGAVRDGKKAAEETKSAVEKGIAFVKEHPKAILIVGILGLLVMLIAGVFSSCTALFAGSGNAVLGSSYTAEDADILDADADYTALEAALEEQISRLERTSPGYDEYRYDLAEIGHNPYELAACLTVLFEDYTRAEVQSTLQSLFARQYTLTLQPEVEVRTRTEIRTGTTVSTDPETGETYEEDYEYEVEVEYEYHILNVKLVNKGVGAAIRDSELTTEQAGRYDVLMMTSGNRPELFGEDVYGVSGGAYTDYNIPGEALTDERFRRMITEAEKYLGTPYVWGGSSPSTSFDCSGFVSWVINHCGNGWDVGRLSARGLKAICDIIPPDQAKPGDLIFFHHTYNAPDPSDATHVGIYVGNGWMLHCGSPISYASIENSYWQEHFLCFGRIR